jgi:hypothetical protein
MINIIDWIIEQEFKSLDDYPCLALPLSKQFKIVQKEIIKLLKQNVLDFLSFIMTVKIE